MRRSFSSVPLCRDSGEWGHDCGGLEGGFDAARSRVSYVVGAGVIISGGMMRGCAVWISGLMGLERKEKKREP